MKVPTDVGPMIPHVGAPSVTLPIEMIFSASKSYFGPASTETQGERIGAAVLGLVNLNLDCGLPCPTPTGVVIAFVSVYTDMSPADVLYGWNAMAIDWCVQTVLNAIGNQLGNMAAPYLGYLLGRLAPQVMSKAAAKALLRSEGGVAGNMINQAARDLVQSQSRAASTYFRALPARMGNISNALSNFFVGGPMGADGSDVGLSTPGGAAGNAAQNYLNGGGTEEHGGSGGGGGQTGQF
jgi:hypothetical protein